MLACDSVTKEQSWIFIQNLGITWGLQSQDLTNLNHYTKHMIQIKIYQMFLKHVVGRHHMGSGLARVPISFNGRFVPWFQLQQGESLLQPAWGAQTQHVLGTLVGAAWSWETVTSKWCLKQEPEVSQPLQLQMKGHREMMTVSHDPLWQTHLASHTTQVLWLTPA